MKSPAFQWYPSDWLSDMKVRMLSWESRGLYIDLLCYCWREGWIPADSSAIAQLCNCHGLAIIEPCLELFTPHPNDPKKLIHKRLDAEREKQKAFSDERKSSGIKGAQKRWGKNSSAIKQPIAKNSSSSSSSSASADNTPINGSKEKSPIAKRFQPPTIDEVAAYGQTLNPPFIDALLFVSYYESNGWKVGKNPMKSWQASVRTWNCKEPNYGGGKPNGSKMPWRDGEPKQTNEQPLPDFS
jgi:uncharacterized protein YdaU (DUF1376 family)